MRTLPILALLLSAAACTTAMPPDNRFTVDYRFTGFSTEIDRSGAAEDSEVTAWRGTYEFLPFGGNANLALSYVLREDQGDVSRSTIETDLLLLQVRFYYELLDRARWYVAPGIGYVLSQSDSTNASFDEGFAWEAETGLVWALDESWGLSASLNWSLLPADSTAGNADLTGFGVAAGIYLDF